MENLLNSLEEVRNKLEADQKRVMKLQGRLEVKLESLSKQGANGTIEAKKNIKALIILKDEVVQKLESLVETFKEDYPELIGE